MSWYGFALFAAMMMCFVGMVIGLLALYAGQAERLDEEERLLDEEERRQRAERFAGIPDDMEFKR